MAVRGSNSLYFSTGLETDGLKQGANEAVGIIGNLAGSISKINPFAILATGAATAFAAIANQAFKMAREFEQAMKEVETISAATQENFKGISSQVFALSKISPDGPAALAKAYYQVVSAGYDGAKGLKLLETATKAATAGVTDTQTAADGITTVLNAFKLSAEDADSVADGLFQTVKLGKTTFSELSQSLAQVAPLAAASGYSFQEILAATATLTKQGTPTAQAMTQIRSGIEAVTEVMGDGVANSMSLQNAFKAVYAQAGGSQNQLKELTGRVEAMNAIIALTGNNAEGAANDLKALGDSAGAAEDAFKRMAGSNVNEWKILGNKIRATTEDVGNGILEMSSGIAKFLNEALDDSEALKKSYDDQRTELFRLRGALQSVSEGSEEFKDLRKQIIDQFPEFIGGIDSEKASTEQLLKVLDQVNDAYVLRYKFEQRQKDLKDELAKQGDIELDLDNAKDRFDTTLAELERIANDKGVTLKINYEDSDSEILAAVRKQIEGVEGAMNTTFDAGDKFNTTVKGWGENYLGSLASIVTRQRVLNKDLAEQSEKVAEITERNERLTKLDLKSKAGQVEAIKRINEAMQASQLTQFAGSGVDAIEKAIEARRKVIEQFRTIDQVKNVDSLKPFLNSELEEIKAYAQKRYRLLNENYAGSGGKGKDGFSEYLEQKKKEYETYYTVLRQLGEEAANDQYQNLLKEGEDYGRFLQNQLDKTKDYAKQRDIALAADKAGIQLNRPQAESVGNVTPAGIMDFSIDNSSINYYQRQISQLNEQIDAEQDEYKRRELQAQRDKFQERLEIARNGAQTEGDIYENLRRGLEDLNNKQLKDYIQYWKDRLKEAKKGSKDEQKALDNIQSAENRMAENTASSIQDISSGLGQASQMFREFGDETLADALEKLSGVANSVGTIISGITSGNWLSVVGGVIGAVTSLFSGSKGDKKTAYEKSIESLEASIKRLGDEIKIALGGEGFEKRVKRLTEFTNTLAEMNEELDKREAIYDKYKDSDAYNLIRIDGMKLEEWVQAQKDAVLEFKAEFQDIKREFEEYVTGSSADALADSLIQGFREGKRGIEDFTDTFEDAMKDTLLNVFKNNYLMQQVQAFYDKLVDAAGGTDFNSLSENEIANLREEFNEMINNAGDKFEALQGILSGAGIDGFGEEALSQRSGLAGAITNITEDTANVLAGYMNAIRIDVRQGLIVNEQSMGHLSEIASNTRYNRFLENIDKNITSMDGRLSTVENGIQQFQAQG